ncbi:hypothetical protein C8F01DRAFT_73174 [Mycena amicta]|nr:hypothetical protein C8F01DRAFT_73174 [Mycena amicta]
MSGDPARQPSASSSSNPTRKPSNLYPNGSAAGLKSLNTGWQVWGSAPSSKRNASMSSLTIASEMQGDHPNVGESWSAPRSASGTWDGGTRPRHSKPGEIKTYCLSLYTQTAENHLTLAMRGMAVEEDLSTRQPFPPVVPVPPQVSAPGLARTSPLPQQRNLYGAYPEYGFYSPGRETFPYYGNPDPNAYRPTGLPMSPYTAAPPPLPINTIDPRQPIYFDYNAARTPQFFFPASQPMLYPPQSPMLSGQLPSTPVTMTEKKAEITTYSCN